MIPACDFCGARGDADDGRVLVEAPCGKVHICDGCVCEATRVLSRKRERDRACAKP